MMGREVAVCDIYLINQKYEVGSWRPTLDKLFCFWFPWFWELCVQQALPCFAYEDINSRILVLRLFRSQTLPSVSPCSAARCRLSDCNSFAGPVGLITPWWWSELLITPWWWSELLSIPSLRISSRVNCSSMAHFCLCWWLRADVLVTPRSQSHDITWSPCHMGLFHSS